jgi:Mo-dependent nitrogenase C-terminus
MLHSTSHKFVGSLLQPIAQKLDAIEMRNAEMAHFFCRLIPAQCPFERDVKCFGRVLFHIPPMCKLNPFYEQLVGLRFKALCYLADVCGEDIAVYC